MPDDGSFRSTTKQPTHRLGGTSGRGWKPGQSGNPGGRRREEATIRQLAQDYCPAAIHALAKLAGLATDANGKPLPGARTDTSRIAAMRELLDRGVGRARQDLTVEGDGTSALALHLLAATAVSQEILAATEQREHRTTINGHVDQPINGHTERGNGTAEPATVRDLLSAPLPTE